MLGKKKKKTLGAKDLWELLRLPVKLKPMLDVENHLFSFFFF